MSRPLRAVLYGRVSLATGDQDTETQRLALVALCQARGYQIVEERSDRITGDPERRRREPPGLTAALTLLEKRRADVLVIFAADRLVRSPIQLLQLCARVQSYGACIVSAQDGADLDTTTHLGELVIFMRGWFARWELKLNRERTKAGLQRARLQGKQLGRREEALPDLQVVAELVKQGKGERKIATALDVPRCRVRKALQALQAQAAELGAQGTGAEWSSNGGAEAAATPEGAEGPAYGG